MAANGIHISLSAEPVFAIGDFVITNSMFTSLIVSFLLITFAFIVNRSLKNTDKPSGIQNFAEWIVESLYNLVYSVTGNLKKTSLFFPLVSTFFLFILLNNWLGLLPGVGTIVVPSLQASEEHVEEKIVNSEIEITEKQTIETKVDDHGNVIAVTEEQPVVEHLEVSEDNQAAEPEHAETVPLFRPGTADLNTTLALGIISVIAVQMFGFNALQFGYFKKFFNFSSPIMFYVGILELISEFAKVISFAFRLFGNVFAGEVLLVVLTSLTKVVGPIPFYGLEVFVGFIQALVFSMLSLVLFNMATMSHDEH